MRSTPRRFAPLILALLVGCLTWLVATDDVGAQEWTRFRGPDGTGVVEAPSIPVEFDESNYQWNVELPGTGHSSPVLWGEKIFLTCTTKEDETRSVVCLDATDGKILWEVEEPYERFRSHGFNSFASSTPAVDAERVYVSWISGETFIVFALDHQGNKVWRRSMGDFKAMFGSGASPIVLDGVVIVDNDHAGQTCFLIGLDAVTGETRWKLPRRTGLASYVAPAVYRENGRAVEVIFAGTAHGITAVDPVSGEVLWEVDGLFTLKSVASPVIAGQLVFASGGKGSGGVESGVVRRGDKAKGQEAELVYELRSGRGSGLPYVPTPVVYNDLLYLWSDAGTVACIEPASGREIWVQETGGQFFASPICVNGLLYNVSKKGQVFVIEAAREYKLAAVNELPEGSYATPAVANGRLYVRTFNRLICVGGK